MTVAACISKTKRTWPEEPNAGKPPTVRVDVRFDDDVTGRIFVLNKAVGVLRIIER